jgi:DNA-binding SARP family transcriptional activator
MPDGPSPVPQISICCLGPFVVAVDGVGIDLAGIRPRARAVLRMLGAHAGEPVHRDTICAALWPEADEETATRGLHVAISAIRAVLEPESGRGDWSLVVRRGDCYVLQARDGSAPELDLARFRSAIARAHSTGNGHPEVAWAEALAVFTGELLPEDGAVDWVVDLRDEMARAAADVAERLAATCLESGDAPGAIDACEQGLRHDRYRDQLWRLLLEATEALGDIAGHARIEERYCEVLEELGLERRDLGVLS